MSLEKNPVYQTNSTPYIILFWVYSVIIGCLVASQLLLHLYHINGDVAWYIVSAEYLLNGYEQSERYFDTNPPYSILFYVPLTILYQLLNIDIDYIIFGICIPFIIFMGWTIFKNTKHCIKSSETALVFAAFYIWIHLNQTTVLLFKDHILSCAILPLIMCQYQIYKDKWKITTLNTAVLITAIPILLIKPFYLLIPGTMIIARLIKHKEISSFFNIDAVYTAFMVLLYLSGTYLFFYNFFSEILPTSLKLYVSQNYFMNTQDLILPAGIFIVFASLFIIRRASPFLELMFFLSTCLLICTFCFLLQNKGFWGHYIPTQYLMLTILFAAILQPFLKQKDFKCNFVSSLLIVLFLILLIPSYLTVDTDDPSSISNTSHALKSFSYFAQKHAENDHFFMEAQMTTVPYIAHVKTSAKFASRFPSMWIPYGIISSELTDTDRDKLTDSFGNMMAEDLERTTPAFLALYENQKNPFNNLNCKMKNIGVLELLKDHKKFKHQMANYYKSDEHFNISYPKNCDKRDTKHTYIIYFRNDLSLPED